MTAMPWYCRVGAALFALGLGAFIIVACSNASDTADPLGAVDEPGGERPAVVEGADPTATSQQLVQPTATVAATESVPPATPAPAPTRIPAVVTGRVGRAGELCVLSAERYNYRFTVPSGTSAFECEFIGSDPVELANNLSASATLRLESVQRNPARALDDLLKEFGGTIETSTTNEIEGFPAWRYGVAAPDSTGVTTTWVLVGVGSDTLQITTQAGSREPALAALEQLLDSLVLEHEDPYGEALQRGGRCASDRWVVDVPTDWFVDGECVGHDRWHTFNTSNIAHIAMQCECLGPLWIRETARPFPGGDIEDEIVELISDDRSIRADGTPMRTREFVWEEADAAHGRRHLFSTALEFGDQTVVVTANRNPDHTGPNHDWQVTLDAHAELVASLRPLGAS